MLPHVGPQTHVDSPRSRWRGRCGIRGWRIAILCWGGVVLAVASAVSAQRPAQRPKRAAAPKQWSQDVLDAFFADARGALVGKRPLSSAGRPPGRAGSDLVPAGDSAPGDAGFAWSRLIRAETIENEVKRYQKRLAEDVRTPSAFKGGDYRKCRIHFSMLAVLFAVAAEYDQEVRWKRNAAVLRSLFARAGLNCKAGTDASFREAQQRREDLESLVRGSRVDGPEPRPDVSWPEIAERPPLMQRMEQAYEQRLADWLANGGELKRNAAEIRHEAELLAMMAEAITRDGFKHADDETYLEYAGQLRDAAQQVAQAAEQGNYALAREAESRLGNACLDCHDDYR